MELKHTRILAPIILILLCFVVSISAFTVRDGEEREREEVPIHKPSLWEIFKNGFPPYTSSPLKVSSYRDKLKSLTSQLHAYFFPPNLDFRGTTSGDDEARVDQSSSPGGGGGAGEKVKEALSKSFVKSKETVEDTAKSAARAVGETMHETKENVKRSFSDRGGHQPEL
ncbi:uncharacterized protein LOC126799575 [Argentina anserina]|uniref:uncharacterized protein LOC126799575 n=1 Tax=Argentina anserina TaxID=57926 RepID=UPI002176631C|nr:uncharacterized protein LOC126799575 [Potentilla anserina]